MSAPLRPWHLVIIAFCVWHMVAVFVYLLPPNGVMKNVRYFSAPYVLALSQWQKWDIFSPNPTRRQHMYRIERNAGDRYETEIFMDFHHLAWYERAKELKVLARLQEGWSKLFPNYLLSLCPRIPGSAGREIRLIVGLSFLPSELAALQRMSTTKVVPEETLLTSVRCPPLE